METRSIISVDFSYADLIDKIVKNERFSFARVGDGEWNAIFRKSGSNCDNHTYFESLGDALWDCLTDSPDYYIGLQNLAYRQRTEAIEQVTEKYNLKWCRADIIHRENGKHGIQSLFDALKGRDVWLVGPQHLHQLAVTNDWYFYQIPSVNCWLKYETTRDEIRGLIGHKDWVILYAASMMANVLVHDFNGQATQIDIGSALDPYAGVKSRSYHFNMNV